LPILTPNENAVQLDTTGLASGKGSRSRREQHTRAGPDDACFDTSGPAHAFRGPTSVLLRAETAHLSLDPPFCCGESSGPEV